MLPRLLRLLPAFISLIFALLAFVFSLLAFTSPEWANRDNFDTLEKMTNWTDANLLYTAHRSPYIICTPTAHDKTVNSTTGGDPVTTTTYTVDCQTFRAYGFDQTSCELQIATQANDASNNGDSRLCQQIHLAGNFTIASVASLTTAFTLSITALLLTIGAFTDREEAANDASTEGDGEAVARGPNHHHKRRRRVRSHDVVTPYVNLALVSLLCVGAVTGVVGQFYAIEGLIQSALNNGDFTTSQGSSPDNGNGPWYQGKALSVYVTCSWSFALAAAAMASRTWRLPRWEKLS